MRRQFLWVAAALSALTWSHAAIGAEKLTFKTTILKPQTVSGTLHLPKVAQTTPVPAVIVVHGTGGPDSRYAFHRDALLDAGFAAFEVDFKQGVFSTAFDRPRSGQFVSAVQAAAALLRGDKRVDGSRIGMLGFSLGGAITLSARPTGAYKAGVAFYPGCKFQRAAGSRGGSAPLLILAGDKDSYGDGANCPAYAQSVGASFKLYPGAYHAFDLAGQAKSRDPIAEGKIAVRKFDAAAADARTRMVAFFREQL